MIIEKKPKFLKGLAKILFYISKDKKSAAKNFEKELNELILNLSCFPKKYRKSYYFDDEVYRDGSWLTYNPTTGSNQITSIAPTEGFWIKGSKSGKCE